MSEWTLLDRSLTLDTIAAGNTGFVYAITRLDTGRTYIGQRTFWADTTKPPLKGAKRRRKVRKESLWRDYWGSSEALREDIKLLGVDAFSREIIYICKTKAELNYMETKTIFALDCLLSDAYYNAFVGCRINRSTVKGLKIDNT